MATLLLLLSHLFFCCNGKTKPHCCLLPWLKLQLILLTMTMVCVRWIYIYRYIYKSFKPEQDVKCVFLPSYFENPPCGEGSSDKGEVCKHHLMCEVSTRLTCVCVCLCLFAISCVQKNLPLYCFDIHKEDPAAGIYKVRI